MDKPAQAGGDDGGRLVDHAGVADQRDVRRELRAMSSEKRAKTRRAALLLAFDEHGDRNRQRAGHVDKGSAGFDKGHQLALVVRCSPGVNPFRTIGIRASHRFEGRRLPFFEGIRRLNIVMAVKKHMRGPFAAGSMAHHHRVPRRVAQAAVEAERCQFGDQPLRRPAALRRIGRVGRNARDAQQLEQPIERAVEIVVGSGEHFVETGHHPPRAASGSRAARDTVTWAQAGRQGACR